MIYCYKCPACKKKKEVIKPASRYKEPELCDVCSFVMNRDFRAEHGGHTDTPGNWPLLSDACGVAHDQVKEAHEESVKAGVPTDFTEDGRAILTSPLHRKKYCEAMGMYDRNAGYSDPMPSKK